MSLKKYMIVDLLILTIIGVLGELLGVYVINVALTATIVTGSVSLLVLLISTTRWGWKGLIPIPVLALAAIISGRFFNKHPEFVANYDWRLYIAMVASYASIVVNLLWLKKIDYKSTYKSAFCILGLCSIIYITSQLILSLVYLILTGGFLFLAFITWNLFMFAILVIGAFVIRRQNILVNVKQSLIEKKEELEFENNIEFDLDDDNAEIKENSFEEEGVQKDGEVY